MVKGIVSTLEVKAVSSTAVVYWTGSGNRSIVLLFCGGNGKHITGLYQERVNY